MPKEDYILTATSADGFVRAFAATTRRTVDTARKIHQTSPVVTAALGRLLTQTAIMGAMLKNSGDTVVCRIKGEESAPNRIGGLIAVGRADGFVKGYPYNAVVDIPLKPSGKLDVSGAIGRGVLNVSYDMGLKEPYISEIPLVSGEIAEDFANYFAVSEQTPTACALGVLVDTDYTVKRAGGLLIQLMPGAPDSLADTLTERLSAMPPVTTLLDSGNTPKDILTLILGDMDIEITGEKLVSFTCDCSRSKMEEIVAALGAEEVADIIAKEGKVEIKCHFCNQAYAFGDGS